MAASNSLYYSPASFMSSFATDRHDILGSVVMPSEQEDLYSLPQGDLPSPLHAGSALYLPVLSQPFTLSSAFDPAYGPIELSLCLPEMSKPVEQPTPTLPYPHRSGRVSSVSSRRYVPIAPKKGTEYSGLGKRKRSASQSVELDEEDTILLRLKDENLSWADIVTRFRGETGKDMARPALQMRLKRIRERTRQWTETELEALLVANRDWNADLFETVAANVGLPWKEPAKTRTRTLMM
jgi:hypothetical protein